MVSATLGIAVLRLTHLKPGDCGAGQPGEGEGDQEVGAHGGWCSWTGAT